MTLLQTVHSMSPWWVLVPAMLYTFGLLLEDYAGQQFKKPIDEKDEQSRTDG